MAPENGGLKGPPGPTSGRARRQPGDSDAVDDSQRIIAHFVVLADFEIENADAALALLSNLVWCSALSCCVGFERKHQQGRAFGMACLGGSKTPGRAAITGLG
jgi:hypothetical protein